MLSSRVQFFRGTTEVLGYGYQASDDPDSAQPRLPACWLDELVSMYFEELLRSLRDPAKVYAGLARRGSGRFVLDRVNPKHNDVYLVADKFVHFADEGKARTLSEIFVGRLVGRGIGRLEYMSEKRDGSKGMQFHVDGGAVKKRYHMHEVAVTSTLLSDCPDLADVLLALIGEIANAFTEGPPSTGTFAERRMLQGLSDMDRTPFTWRSDARRLLHRLPDAVFKALESAESATDSDSEDGTPKSAKAERITQFETIIQEATKARA